MNAPSSTETALPFLRRPDLVIRKLNIGSRVQWTVKDPVSLRFFQLREEEYFVFSRLTSDATVETLVSSFDKLFAPARLSLPRLDSYLRTLLAMGLIIDRSSDGSDLLAHGDRMRRANFLASIGNPLVVRWRGFNPRLLIDALYPLVRWCYTATFVVAAIALMLMAVFWMTIHHEDVVARLPTVSAFVSVHNLVWIGAAICVAKVLHELGHALTCKHFGGECREMGLMLLVFTPCLYCNVSDAWLMNNRWHRIAISGAGIFVESLLATAACFLWWFSEPGVLNTICMNMMIVCSMNTLVFNGNPLLKYDGYYVLSDLVQVPNLTTRSRSRVVDLIMRWTCGVRFVNPRTLPGRGDFWLVLYGIASFLYRWFVFVLILWGLHVLLRPMGLVAVAQAISVAALTTFVIAGMRSFRMTARRLRSLPTNKLRIAFAAALVYFAATALWSYPIPRYVSAPVVIEPTGAATVYVEEAGRLPRSDDTRPSSGDSVKAGDILAVLENPDLSRDVLELRERIEVLRLRIETMESGELQKGRANENLPASRELLASLENQMSNFRERYEKLTLRAPVGGVLIGDPWRPETNDPIRLERWTGTPLSETSVGGTLQRGTVYCSIGDPEKLSATVVVEESDIELVEVGQSARVWLRENPGVVASGSVAEISRVEIEQAPNSLVNKEDVALINDPDGQQRMAAVSFNVRIPLAETDDAIPVRATGWAKIEVPSITLGQRIKRYLLSTFRLSM